MYNVSFETMKKAIKSVALQRNKAKLVPWTLWILSVLWFMFLVWMSSEDGTATSLSSWRIAVFVARLLSMAPDHIKEVDSLLRTLAHFVGFFIFGGLVFGAARATWHTRKHVLLFSISICSVLAVLDEVKKVLIPGRHLSWPEAGLNVLGVLGGTFVSFLLIWTVTRKTGKLHIEAAGTGASAGFDDSTQI